MFAGKRGLTWFLPTLALCSFVILSTAALQGCGKDTAKQDFIDGVLSIMDENQAHPEIAREGGEAYTAYAQSGFIDVDQALKAADSFRESNAKDEDTLTSLKSLEKPDEEARSVVDTLEKGIETMDEGNTINARELDKAPDQGMEERASIFNSSLAAMDKYIEGVSQIIESYRSLLEYAESNSLDGQEEIRDWLDRFEEEKKSFERSKSSMEGMTQS